MNLFEQIKNLRNQSSSSTSTSTSSSSTHSSDDENSQSNASSFENNNNDDDETETNNDDNDEIDSDTQLAFWKQGTSNAWGPVQIEYKIQPNKIEKKLGMFQSSFLIHEPFEPQATFKSKSLYKIPNVSRTEIEKIMSQRGLFDV